MATLTALAIAAASAAAVGAAALASKLEKPEPAVEQEPAAEPEVEAAEAAPAPEPAPEPAPAPAPEPAPEAKPEPLVGGSLGRPPWGVLVSNVPASSIEGAIASAVGTVNPKDLQVSLTDLNEKLETAIYNAYNASEKIKELKKYREDIIGTFGEEDGKLKAAESLSKYFLEKLTKLPKQLNQKEIDDLNRKIKEERAKPDKDQNKINEWQAKIDASKAKPEDDKTLEGYGVQFSKYNKEKVVSQANLEEYTREKERIDREVGELRKTQDEQEALAKDLRKKRDALLVQINQVELARKKATLPADWDYRRKRYADATAAFVEADNRVKSFYTEIWQPLERNPAQQTYQGRFTELKKARSDAQMELERARIGLTAPEKQGETPASFEFKKYIQDVKDAVGNLSPTDLARFPLPGGISYDRAVNGYPVPVYSLLEIIDDDNLQRVANVYYEISGHNVQEFLRYLDRYLDFFKRIYGTTFKASERTRVLKNLIPTVLITSETLDEFLGITIPEANNSVLTYIPPPGGNPEEKLYVKLRDLTQTFIDKQLSTITRMLKVIRDAKQTVRIDTGTTVKNLRELDEIVSKLFASLPALPMAQCMDSMPAKTYEIFSTGKFNGADVEAILDGSDGDARQALFDAIGFAKITNLEEATAYHAKYRSRTADLILQRATLEDTARNAETLARNDPSQANKDAATAARQAANANPFVPGVFLKASDDELVTIKTFIDSCELDGNVGQGKDVIDRISKLLKKLETNREALPEEKKSDLIKFIKELTSGNIIRADRADRSVVEDNLENHGFTDNVLKKWSIIDVNPENSLLQTWLTLRSPDYRSIVPTARIIYKGKSVNARKQFLDLALEEIKKIPFFTGSSLDKESDIELLSSYFNVNVIIFHGKTKDTPAYIDTTTANNRVTTFRQYIFTDGKNFYPIRVEAVKQIVRNRDITRGGAVDSDGIQVSNSITRKVTRTTATVLKDLEDASVIKKRVDNRVKLITEIPGNVVSVAKKLPGDVVSLPSRAIGIFKSLTPAPAPRPPAPPAPPGPPAPPPPAPPGPPVSARPAEPRRQDDDNPWADRPYRELGGRRHTRYRIRTSRYTRRKY